MPETQSQPVHFRRNDGEIANEATLNITLFDQGDRVKRALKFLGLSWLAAGVALFIPIAHFVLVPGFVLLGIYLAVSASRTSQAMDNAKGECPNCNNAIEIKMESSDTLPKWTYCPSCNESIQITS
ncbi:MAG: hypothetical protein PVJ39_16625 [Gammaproteobacteria bacterium]|jgi:hypothetical protein